MCTHIAEDILQPLSLFPSKQSVPYKGVTIMLRNRFSWDFSFMTKFMVILLIISLPKLLHDECAMFD